MSLVINHRYHQMITNLRGQIHEAVMQDDEFATQHATGVITGYLIGLHDAGEIDQQDVQAFEEDVAAGVQFILNATRQGKAS